MICQYLDPVFLAMDYEPYGQNKYEECYISLFGFFEKIENIERNFFGELNKFLKLKGTSELINLFYCYNPWANYPFMPSFYSRKYKKIFSLLIRRFEYCDDIYQQYNDSTPVEIISKNPNLNDQIIESWNRFLNSCEICENENLNLLISHERYGSSDESDFFRNKILRLKGDQEENFNNYLNFFDLNEYLNYLDMETYRNQIEFITLIYKLQYYPNLNNSKINYKIDKKFWQTLERSNFINKCTEYKMKVTQVLTNLIYDIQDPEFNRHKWSDSFINTSYGKCEKWSIYVYQNSSPYGDETSRIHFGYTSALIIYEFKLHEH